MSIYHIHVYKWFTLSCCATCAIHSDMNAIIPPNIAHVYMIIGCSGMMQCRKQSNYMPIEIVYMTNMTCLDKWYIHICVYIIFKDPTLQCEITYKDYLGAGGRLTCMALTRLICTNIVLKLPNIIKYQSCCIPDLKLPVFRMLVKSLRSGDLLKSYKTEILVRCEQNHNILR